MSKCVEAYCLNQPEEGGLMIEIGLLVGGFAAVTSYDGSGNPVFGSPVDGLKFEVPDGARVRVFNEDSVQHTVRAEDGAWSIVIAAGVDSFLPTAATSTRGSITIVCDTLAEIRTAVLRVYFPGVFDINQSVGNHAGGCCRASIKATLRHWYVGFSRFDGAAFPKYKTYDTTIETYPFDATLRGPLHVATFYAGGEVSGQTSVGGCERITRERWRHNRYVIRGRTEISLAGALNYQADFINIDDYRTEKWLEVAGDPDTEYFLYWETIEGAEQIISATRKEIPLYYNIRDSRTNEYVIGPLIGKVIFEVKHEYTIDDCIADVNSLLVSFDDIAMPYCAVESQWFGGPTVTIGNQTEQQGPRYIVRDGVSCNITQTEGVPWTLHSDVASENTWPPAAWNGPEPEPDGSTGQVPDYRCVFSEPNGNVLAQAASNLGAQSDPPPVLSLSEELWRTGPANSIYKNECASAQINDSVISPPVHFMSGITVTVPASNLFILIERTVVKRWWSAPYCRRVWQNLNGTVSLMRCEHSTGTFDGANKVPAGATYDVSGNYTLTGLKNGATYKWTKGANDVTLAHREDTLTSDDNFTKATGDVILTGSPNATVTAQVRGDNGLAPCAMIDDVAERLDMYDASLGIGSTWNLVRGWFNLIAPGQTFSMFSEMDCPDRLVSNPPCGCPP